MLSHLEIKNYAIIQSLKMELTDGMTILTGETGAGKSILLGALGLVMGNRADTSVLYNTDENCLVEAIFQIEKYRLQPFFEEHDIDYADETIIRRIIYPTGKSRAFINDIPTTLNVLKELMSFLVDLHQQFDVLDINKASFQINTIDALAGNQKLVERYRTGYDTLKKEERELHKLQERQQQSHNEMDFLNFQMKEFNDAELMPGEQEEKESILAKLSAAEDIQQYVGMLAHELEDSELNIGDKLQELINNISNVSDKGDDIKNLHERLISVKEELHDIAITSREIVDNLDFDPEYIQELNDRLSVIYKLQKKHGVSTLEALLEVQDSISTQLDSYGDLSQDIKQLEKRIEQRREILLAEANTISEKRAGVVSKFEDDVHKMLVPLSMEHAYIKVSQRRMESLGPNGIDEIEFLFSPNKGSQFKKLKDIASGGELSRVTLVVKALVADAVTLPTLIYDEIDSGVSGEVAGRMGNILADLSKNYQVIVITHSPQIAARAHTHYFVYKEDRADRTTSGIRVLDRDGRVKEIAKMLSSDPPTQAAIKNAEELIQSA